MREQISIGAVLLRAEKAGSSDVTDQMIACWIRLV
jgi:hypothetical protein